MHPLIFLKVIKDFLEWFKCENLKKNLTENNRITYHYQSFSNKSHQKYFAQAIKVKEDENIVMHF